MTTNTNNWTPREVVAQNVLLCMTSIVEELLKAHGLDSDLGFDLHDHIEELFEYEGETYTREQLEGTIEDLADGNEEEIEEILDNEGEYPEPLEWWAVSSHLADFLKGENKVIIEEHNMCLWGRCTSGQSIEMDHVIQKYTAYLNE